MTKLEKIRLEKGFSQRALAEKSGVSPATVYELENGRRKPNPSTLRKLARALEVDVKNLTEEKVEVRVEWEDDNGTRFAEKLRFTGNEVEAYNADDITYTLYECPGGYRVHEVHGENGHAYLFPNDPSAEESYHRLFSADEVAEEYPVFSYTLDVVPVRDID